MQLQSFHSIPFNQQIALVQGFSAAEKGLMSQVVALVQLLLVMPVTNAISECAHSLL